MDRLAYQEQRLRWLLKDVEIMEHRAQLLHGKVRMLKISLRIKGAHDRILLAEATRARGDSRLVAAWAHQLEGEAQVASKGAARSGSRHGHATSVHGLAATLRDRSKKLSALIDKVAGELERQYREVAGRFDDPLRHASGAGAGADGFLEIVSSVTDFLELVEKFLHHALHRH